MNFMESPLFFVLLFMLPGLSLTAVYLKYRLYRIRQEHNVSLWHDSDSVVLSLVLMYIFWWLPMFPSVLPNDSYRRQANIHNVLLVLIGVIFSVGVFLKFS